MYDSARAVFSALRAQVQGANQMFVNFELARIDEKVLERQGKSKEALAKADEILTKYAQLGQMGLSGDLAAVTQLRDTLAAHLGIVDTTKAFTPPAPAPQAAPPPAPVPSAKAPQSKVPPAKPREKKK